MIHVVSTAKMSEKHQRRLREHFPDIRFSFFENIHEALPTADQADVLVTYGEDLNEERLARFSRLRWIQVISAGLEKMPFSALRERNIRVTNARGIHAVPMAEYTLAVMLQITRRVHDLYQFQLQKKWDRTIRVGELAGKTAAIVGAGAIGKGIAKRLKALDLVVKGINTTGDAHPCFDFMGTRKELCEVLASSDFVIVTVPLTDQTRGLIGARELAAMKPTACLIHLARGGVVDESALVEALRNRKIGGAVLDVFEEEPLPEDHPFWTLDNVILTPHISGRSPLYMTRAMEIFHRNLQVFASGAGEMVNLIDLSRGY